MQIILVLRTISLAGFASSIPRNCERFGGLFGKYYIALACLDIMLDTVFAVSHLLVTRPSKSRALECFVIDISQRSTHIAMLVRFPQVLYDHQ